MNTIATETNTPLQQVIEIANLKKSFGSQQVLEDVSLNLFKGENLVVLGKSGSGKSVLIKCIVRLLIPDGGTIQVLGENISTLKSDQLGKLRQKIGFLFQSGALYDSMSVKENLEFPLRRIRKNLTEKEIQEKILEVLENVGLADA
ncbi:MAG: ATP-binding cassette domain-containing protein, partial [Prolixibacteraceae bacterium]